VSVIQLEMSIGSMQGTHQCKTKQERKNQCNTKVKTSSRPITRTFTQMLLEEITSVCF